MVTERIQLHTIPRVHAQVKATGQTDVTVTGGKQRKPRPSIDHSGSDVLRLDRFVAVV